MLKTNINRLVKMSVVGEVSSPILAIIDAGSYGRIYKEGAVSIGIVVHSNRVTSGMVLA